MSIPTKNSVMPDSPPHDPNVTTENPLLNDSPSINKSQPHSTRFWIIIAALSLLAFICALDATIITTPLPTIVEEIGGETQYVWIANSFVIAATVLQPLFGQLANVFGRKIPILTSLILFMLGSGLAGGSRNPGMFITGRTIQGAGAGGIYVLIDIVCCDLVPLRDRGKYLGIVNACAGVASGLGPVVGGAFGRDNWPWIFYINLPICALPLVTIFLVMRTKTGLTDLQSAKGLRKLRQLDIVGNLIFIPSMIAILFGLVSGGIQYPWSSWRIILPLILGVVGWAVFHIQQHFATDAMVPERLFTNRTSAAAYVLSFLTSFIAQTTLYFIPIYLQSIVGADVLLSGVYFLPTALGILVFAAVAGVVLSKTGAYKVLHWVAFALSSLGFGLFTLLDINTPTVAWVFYQLIAAAGSGIPISTLLPAIMAGLPESDVAASTSIFSFIKTFGYIWGVTVPSIVFNAVFNDNLFRIGDADVRNQLKDGAAYSYASQAYVARQSLSSQTWEEVEAVYVSSLRAIWWLGLSLSLLGFLVVFVERHLELRTELQTDFGLDEEAEELGTTKEAVVL
ncbi:MFS general substrate transporter [Annulohypoxylon nitens]|nr:MFS general substrate transporter [Annulohypoxylon nitens]